MAELDADMNEDLLGLDQRPLDESDGGNAPRSLYRRILGDIEARILSGQWPPGHRIPYDAGTFDVALASCVFHHIPHAQHVELLAEIRRVLVPGGRLFVFEHNPLNPLTRHAVNTCEFDEHAELVPAPTMRRRARDAGFAAAAIRYRIFFPHALRRLRPLEARLTWLPLGAQYYVAAQKAS